MCKRLVFTSIFLVLFYSSNLYGQYSNIGTFRFQVKQGSHNASIVINTISFNRNKHKVFIKNGNETIIDGHQAFGTDGNIPIVEIASIKLLIDVKNIPIQRRLYADCYEPRFDAQSFKVSFNQKTQNVIIEMHGSDGAASYSVTWHLRKNGRHKKFASFNLSPEE